MSYVLDEHARHLDTGNKNVASTLCSSRGRPVTGDRPPAFDTCVFESLGEDIKLSFQGNTYICRWDQGSGGTGETYLVAPLIITRDVGQVHFIDHDVAVAIAEREISQQHLQQLYKQDNYV